MRGERIPEQIVAIQLIETHKGALASQSPEIADKYQEGVPLKDLIEDFDICKRFNTTPEISKGLVRAAIKDLLGEETYTMVTERYQREQNRFSGRTAAIEKTGVHALSEEQKRLNATKGGNAVKEQGVGIFAISSEERAAIGKRTHEAGVGVHAQTSDELSRRAADRWAAGEFDAVFDEVTLKESGRRLTKLVDKDQWESDFVDPKTGMNELEYLKHLLTLPEFMHQSGRNKGRPDSERITRALNIVFPPGEHPEKSKLRTTNAVQTKIYRIRKKSK